MSKVSPLVLLAGGVLLLSGGSAASASSIATGDQGFDDVLGGVEIETGFTGEEPHYAQDNTAIAQVTSSSTHTGQDLVDGMRAMLLRGPLPYKLGGNGHDLLPYACSGRDLTKLTGELKILCSDPRGIDCSAPTHVVALKLGIKLPRRASKQHELCVRAGTIHTDESRARNTPGTQIFFWPSRKRSKMAITHVETSTGDGSVVAAWVSKGLTEQSWGWWKSRSQQRKYGWRIVYGEFPQFQG